MSTGTRIARRGGGWLVATALVVLSARTLVYLLAPRPTLIGTRLEYQAGGPRLVVLALSAIAVATALSCAVVWLVAVAVSERSRLEPLAAPIGRISGSRVAVHGVGLWLGSSIGFAVVESYLHWRAGLGWHGIHCLVGPVHRDAIPILAALSLLASSLAAVLAHLLRWMRRVVASLRRAPARLKAIEAAMPRPNGVLLHCSSAGRADSPRAPPGWSPRP